MQYLLSAMILGLLALSFLDQNVGILQQGFWFYPSAVGSVLGFVLFLRSRKTARA